MAGIDKGESIRKKKRERNGQLQDVLAHWQRTRTATKYRTWIESSAERPMADYQSPDGLLHGWQCAVGRGIHSQRKKRWLHRWTYDKVFSMVAAPAQIKHTRTPVAPKKIRQSTAVCGTTEFYAPEIYCMLRKFKTGLQGGIAGSNRALNSPFAFNFYLTFASCDILQNS